MDGSNDGMGGSMMEPAAANIGMPPVSSDVTAGPATVTGAGVPALPEEKKSHGTLIETIILIVVSLLAIAAIVFAVYYYLQWDEAQTNVDGKIDAAVSEARVDQQIKDEANFAEREKKPYLEFAGPADYGAVSFMYPKTWSVYVEKDAAKGGDFTAYFNPLQVNVVSTTTINSLRMSIVNRSIESERKQYDNLAENGKLKYSVFQVGPIVGDRYEGEFNKDIVGVMIMFKVNDKTAILRTDAMLFKDDFETLIQTLTMN